MIELRGPADADHFRVKHGRYGDRWYCDPLPGDRIALATAPDDAWPSVSAIKSASGSDWSYVAMKRIAAALGTDAYRRLDLLEADSRYETLKIINKLGLERAGQRGTNVHSMFEARSRNRMPTITHTAPGFEYRAAVEQFFDQYQPELIASEFVCIDRDLNGIGYGGTSDAGLMIDGDRLIVDYKSRGIDSDHGAYPEEAAQLAAYARCQYVIVENDDGEPERRVPPQWDGGLIISVKPDGCRLYPIDLDKARRHWEALHGWWSARLDERSSIGRQLATRKASNVATIAAEASPPPLSDPPPFESAGDVVAAFSADTISIGIPAPIATTTDGGSASAPTSAASDPPPFDEVVAWAMNPHESNVPPSFDSSSSVRPSLGGRAAVRAQLNGAPDEGQSAEQAEIDALAAKYGALGSIQRHWANDIAESAEHARTPMHVGALGSVRRLSLVAALTAFAGQLDDDGDSARLDESVRCVLAVQLGEIAHNDTLSIGELVGSLDAEQAERFEAHADQFVNGTVDATVADDGRVSLHFEQREYINTHS